VGRPARRHGFEELEHPYPVPVEYARGRYLLVFDPLDGSSTPM